MVRRKQLVHYLGACPSVCLETKTERHDTVRVLAGQKRCNITTDVPVEIKAARQPRSIQCDVGSIRGNVGVGGQRVSIRRCFGGGRADCKTPGWPGTVERELGFDNFRVGGLLLPLAGWQ